ncbi:17471_t:CDS:2 [Funneliformis caledonium]|uniref:17471_t:CDS:1 n=1 Tax=Funneliformis caledonium TaxID=1117310 RepID=A0A9N9DPA8_9GLOM|nr:17471_t:CDS:2 [Funneliformis caledonium]
MENPLFCKKNKDTIRRSGILKSASFIRTRGDQDVTFRCPVTFSKKFIRQINEGMNVL